MISICLSNTNTLYTIISFQVIISICLFVSLFVSLVGWFYGISTFVGDLMLNPFLYK